MEGAATVCVEFLGWDVFIACLIVGMVVVLSLMFGSSSSRTELAVILSPCTSLENE